ncbi:MAG TPA: helix-turn-helix transcriptional regulator [Acidobacteriaceae bacterium]|jgi:transcriptional regulator with XRE-family HTH domain|nr:helix-turn-helix transcriptional regulator [Acidobacteriaceae bacterium]
MTSETPQATFSELLRDWRRNQGLRQTDFGELLNPKVRPSTVCCWERNVRRPSLKYLAQIVEITGISPSLALGVDRQEDSQP